MHRQALLTRAMISDQIARRVDSTSGNLVVVRAADVRQGDSVVLSSGEARVVSPPLVARVMGTGGRLVSSVCARLELLPGSPGQRGVGFAATWDAGAPVLVERAGHRASPGRRRAVHA